MYLFLLAIDIPGHFEQFATVPVATKLHSSSLPVAGRSEPRPTCQEERLVPPLQAPQLVLSVTKARQNNTGSVKRTRYTIHHSEPTVSIFFESPAFGFSLFIDIILNRIDD